MLLTTVWCLPSREGLKLNPAICCWCIQQFLQRRAPLYICNMKCFGSTCIILHHVMRFFCHWPHLHRNRWLPLAELLQLLQAKGSLPKSVSSGMRQINIASKTFSWTVNRPCKVIEMWKRKVTPLTSINHLRGSLYREMFKDCLKEKGVQHSAIPHRLAVIFPSLLQAITSDESSQHSVFARLFPISPPLRFSGLPRFHTSCLSLSYPEVVYIGPLEAAAIFQPVRGFPSMSCSLDVISTCCTCQC